jgi:hypothetical protein
VSAPLVIVCQQSTPARHLTQHFSESAFEERKTSDFYNYNIDSFDLTISMFVIGGVGGGGTLKKFKR